MQQNFQCFKHSEASYNNNTFQGLLMVATLLSIVAPSLLGTHFLLPVGLYVIFLMGAEVFIYQTIITDASR